MRISDWSSDVCSSDLEIQDDEAGHRRLDDVAPERLDGFLFLRVQAQCGHGMSPRSQRGKLLMWDLDGRCQPRGARPRKKHHGGLPTPEAGANRAPHPLAPTGRSEEHTSALQSLMRTSLS